MRIDRTKLAKLATIRVYCTPEHLRIEGTASAIDPETDREVAAEIRGQLEAGNEWAWCAVEVRATYAGVDGADFLGACSFASEADFRSDGYFEDMRAVALERLALELKDSARMLELVKVTP